MRKMVGEKRDVRLNEKRLKRRQNERSIIGKRKSEKMKVDERTAKQKKLD